jgi:hypothetical protein
VGALAAQGRDDEARAAFVASGGNGTLVASSAALLVAHQLGMREAFYFLGAAMPGLRGWHAFDELYDALGQPDADHAILRARLSALDPDGANEQVQTLLIALGAKDISTNSWVQWLPVLREYRQSSRFHRMTIDTGMLDYWRTAGFPPGCRAVGDDDFACD